MRIYTNFKEAVNEVRRDLKEMGIRVHPKTYQDKYVANDPDFSSLELQNYIYTVTSPDPSHLVVDESWANAEFVERVLGGEGPQNKPVNPGEAWKLRRDVWEQFLECPETCGELDEECPSECGLRRFAYTYSERMWFQYRPLLEEMVDNPESRQLYLSIWDPYRDIGNLGGVSRVPCSLGYLFQIRRGQLNMTYLMRSSDFATHFQNDVYLAVKLQEYFSEKVHIPKGYFTHFIGSLHVFQKDVKGVF